MGNADCKECATCDNYNDRYQSEKYLISHCESVEEFMYYLPKHGEAIETYGPPTIFNVVDYEMESDLNHTLKTEYDEGKAEGCQVDISEDDGEYPHRSMELIEGQLDEFGLITGYAKTKFKTLWT
jgi:hypothetical protein